jgi:hypothetical protein
MGIMNASIVVIRKCALLTGAALSVRRTCSNRKGYWQFWAMKSNPAERVWGIHTVDRVN